MVSALDKSKKFREKMEAALIRLSQTDEGLHILRYLYLASGFNSRTVVVTKDGKVDTNATFWNDARRDNYIDLRQFMTKEVITAVELDIPQSVIKKPEEEIGLK